MSKITETLRALELRDINPGTWSGSHGWSPQTSGPLIESINPSTGERPCARPRRHDRGL